MAGSRKVPATDQRGQLKPEEYYIYFEDLSCRLNAEIARKSKDPEFLIGDAIYGWTLSAADIGDDVADFMKKRAGKSGFGPLP